MKKRFTPLFSLFILSAFPIGTTACKKDAPESAASQRPVKKIPPKGQIRVNDKWVDIDESVLHLPSMDLFVRCQLQRDDAKERQLPIPPLCYQNEIRPLDAVTTLSLEVWPSSMMALKNLETTSQGAHFMIERGGGSYQLLDLSYDIRRKDAISPNEIRVLTDKRERGEAFVESIKGLLPNAKFIEIEPTLPPKEAPPKEAPSKEAPSPNEVAP